MTDQERNQILKMIESGKISAEEGLRLMQTLEKTSDDNIKVFEPACNQDQAEKPDPEMTSRFARIRRFWQLPLWLGIVVTALGGWLMAWVMQNNGMNFWFYCSWLPFLLGVLLIATAWGSRTARWIHVRVKRKAGVDGPKNIAISMPIPLRLTTWAVRTFGHNLRERDKFAVDEVMRALEHSVNSDSPLYVEVDEPDDDDVEHVQVYIG